MNGPAKVAIIGGGVTGLTTAYRLEQWAKKLPVGQIAIDLFESSGRLGGKLNTVKRDGLTMELGAESFLSRKKSGIDLCSELGLLESLRGTRPENKKTFIWQDERMHRLPEGLTGFVPGNIKSLFSTTLLGWTGKLRLAAELLVPAKKSDEDESLAAFMTRRMGKQAFHRLIQPLLCGIYAADGKQLSVQSTYPEFRTLEKKYGSLIRGMRQRQKAMQAARHEQSFPSFVTLEHGMSQLIERLASELSISRIRFDHPVSTLSKRDDGWNVNVDGDEIKKAGSDFSGSDLAEYDCVVAACPAFALAKMLKESDFGTSQQLARIPHVSTAAVNLWFREDRLADPLEGYGFVVPTEQQNGVTAVTWTSSKHFDRAPHGTVLIRAYLGRSGDEVTDQQTDDQIMKTVRRELKRFMDIDAVADGYMIHRWHQGSPQYTMAHPKILKSVQDGLGKLPGLFVCGASYGGVGIPDCIRQANEAAQAAIHYLKNHTEKASRT